MRPGDSAADDSVPADKTSMFKIGMQDDVGEVYLFKYQPAIRIRRGLTPSAYKVTHKVCMIDDKLDPEDDRYGDIAEPTADQRSADETFPAVPDHTYGNGTDPRDQAGPIIGDDSVPLGQHNINATHGHSAFRKTQLHHNHRGEAALTAHSPSQQPFHVLERIPGDHPHTDEAAAPWPLFTSTSPSGRTAQMQHAQTDVKQSTPPATPLPTPPAPPAVAPWGHDQANTDGIVAHTSRIASEPNSMQLHVAVYSLARRQFVSRAEFLGSHRLISLDDNCFVPMPDRLRSPELKGVNSKHEVCTCCMIMIILPK